MWFKNLIQGGKTKPGGYLSKLEETFSTPGRDTAMEYWERKQGYTKIREWKYEKSRKVDEDEENESADVKESRLRQKNLLMRDEDEDVKKRMPRSYVARKPKVTASRTDVYKLMFRHGFANKIGRAEATLEFLDLEDEEIVNYYAQVARGILDYFKCCDNFKEIKPYVDYYVRFSCLFTLSKKYNEHPQMTYKRFSKELLVQVEDEQGDCIEKHCFPSSYEIRRMIRGYSAKSLIDIHCPLK